MIYSHYYKNKYEIINEIKEEEETFRAIESRIGLIKKNGKIIIFTTPQT